MTDASSPRQDAAAADDARETPTQASSNLDATMASAIQAASGPSDERFGPGARFDAYELIAKLGEGGMGAVWKARHSKLDKLVALKLLPAHLTSNADAIARFEREMRAVGKLEHVHIVRAMDAREVDGVHFLVMELVEGRDLAQLVRERGPRPVAEACQMIRHAALGLAHAHEHGLVHRDIKPSNLLLSKQGQVKILDLGLARLQDEGAAEAPALTTLGTVMGTPDFMAPEQWESTHGAGPAVDLYALGCTLFFLLTGRAPFGDEAHTTLLQKMKGHALEEPPRLRSLRPEVPEEIDELCGRLLAKDPQDRPASAKALAAQLQDFLRGKTAAAVLPQDISLVAATPNLTGSLPTVTLERAAIAGSDSQGPRTRATFPAWLAAGAGLLLLLGGLAWYLAQIVLRVETKIGTVIVEIDQPEAAGAEVSVDGQQKITLRAGRDQPPIKITADEQEHLLKVVKEGFETFTKKFNVRAGKETPIRVRLQPKGGLVALPPVPPAVAGRDCRLWFDGEQSCIVTPVSLAELGLFAQGKSATFEALVIPEQQLSWAATPKHPLDYPGLMGVYQTSAVQLLGSPPRWHLSRMASEPARMGQQQHIAVVWDGSAYHLYVDGRKQPGHPPGAFPQRPVDGLFSLAGWMSPAGISNNLRGTIDEIRLSSIVRYTDEFDPVARHEPDEHTVALYHCDEGAGIVLADASVHQRHAYTLGGQWRGPKGEAMGVAAPPERSDDSGSALELRGPSRAEAPSLVYTSGALTMEAWVCHPDTFTHYHSSPTALGLGPFQLKLYKSTQTCEFLVYQASSKQMAGAIVELQPDLFGQWIHLAGQWDGEELRLYLNGKLASARRTSDAPEATTQQIKKTTDEILASSAGGRLILGGGSSNTQWIGLLDEVRISSIARYSEPFTPAKRFEPDEHTLALYHCDEAEGMQLVDSSLNGHHGRIQGESWTWAYSTSTGGHIVAPQTPADPERAVALWALRHGGCVGIEGRAEEIESSRQLPEGPFRLRSLDLRNAAVVKQHRMPNLAQTAGLRKLSLGRTPLAGVISQLKALPELEDLDCTGQSVMAAEAVQLAGLTALKRLTLADAVINDAAVAELANSSRLVQLDLSRSKITDAALEALQACATLTELDVSGTKVSAEAIARLKAALPECEVIAGSSSK